MLELLYKLRSGGFELIVNVHASERTSHSLASERVWDRSLEV